MHALIVARTAAERERIIGEAATFLEHQERPARPQLAARSLQATPSAAGPTLPPYILMGRPQALPITSSRMLRALACNPAHGGRAASAPQGGERTPARMGCGERF
jgi:hypothetical protein